MNTNSNRQPRQLTYQKLVKSLLPIYDEGEAKAVVRLLLEDKFGLSFTDICCGAIEALQPEQKEQLDKMMARLRLSEPVQYVLGHAEFAGRMFKVRPGVLIPRPETETLCQMVTGSISHKGEQRILDIGTGSGCIAITLKLQMPWCKVSAWDISPDAISVAGHNACRLGADVALEISDALIPPITTQRWDAIVSNPPYICIREKTQMSANVLNNEPHTALFVPDDDPLLFYRAIANYACNALSSGGMLFFEINPLYAREVAAMLGRRAFDDIEIVNDDFGKQRFVKACMSTTQ